MAIQGRNSLEESKNVCLLLSLYEFFAYQKDLDAGELN